MVLKSSMYFLVRCTTNCCENPYLDKSKYRELNSSGSRKDELFNDSNETSIEIEHFKITWSRNTFFLNYFQPNHAIIKNR